MSGGKKPESSVPTDQTCVVSTVAGDGTDRCRDGIGTAAHLDRPSGLVRADDGKSLVFTETGSGRVRSFDMTSGLVVTITGAKKGFRNGDLNSAAFNGLRSICTDPRNPQRYWVGDDTSIRYCDGKTITLLAGGEESGYQDGTGENARFNFVYGMACTQNGDKLYVADNLNNRIRMVDTETGQVKTVAGNGQPESKDGIGLDASTKHPGKVLFYRSSTIKPDSVLFFTSADGRLRRLDIESGKLSTVKLMSSVVTGPHGIDCTPSGHLLVSCIGTHSIYSINPLTGEAELLVGSGGSHAKGFSDGSGQTARFNWPSDLVVNDRETCVFVADQYNNRIRRVQLPSRLFVSEQKTVSPAPTANPDHQNSSESNVRSGSVKPAAIDTGNRPADPAQAVEMKQIQSELKLIWDEVIRRSNLPRTIVCDTIGLNPSVTKVLATKELRDLTLKLEACMTRLETAVSEMQSEREALNHYKQLISSLYAELKLTNERAAVSAVAATNPVLPSSTPTTPAPPPAATIAPPGTSVSDELKDLLVKMRKILLDFQTQQPKLVERIQPISVAPVDAIASSIGTVDVKIERKSDAPTRAEHAQLSYATSAKLSDLQHQLENSQNQLTARDQKIAKCEEIQSLTAKADAEIVAKLTASLKQSGLERSTLIEQITTLRAECDAKDRALKVADRLAESLRIDLKAATEQRVQSPPMDRSGTINGGSGGASSINTFVGGGVPLANLPSSQRPSRSAPDPDLAQPLIPATNHDSDTSCCDLFCCCN